MTFFIAVSKRKPKCHNCLKVIKDGEQFIKAWGSGMYPTNICKKCLKKMVKEMKL